MLIMESVLSKICFSNVVLLFFLEKSFAMPLSNITNNSTNETWCDSDCVEFINQLFLAEKILYILISILIILGNTLVLLVTWRERSLHQPNKYFIACLAVADLLVGIFIGPVQVYILSVDYGSLHNIHLCRFMVCIDILVLTASICSLMFISFDRYLKISKPLQYRSRMTTSKSLKIIFIIWLISIAFATYAATPDSGSTGFLLNSGYLCSHLAHASPDKRAFLYIIVIFLPTIVILIMYALIFVVAHKRQKMLRNGELGETGQNQRSALRHDLKIVRMLLTVVGVFLFCWLPLSITWFLFVYSQNTLDDWLRRSWRSHFIIYSVVVWLLPLINSLCNPIIYASLDQTYREAFKHQFQKMMCRTRSNTQQPPATIELRSQRNN